jgi:hypothetical protein
MLCHEFNTGIPTRTSALLAQRLRDGIATRGLSANPEVDSSNLVRMQSREVILRLIAYCRAHCILRV